jgi:hypothetical protein
MSLTKLTFPRGNSAGFQINLGFNTTGGSWEVLENELGIAPTFNVVSHALGQHQMRWSPTITDDMEAGSYVLRVRINLPADEALALGFLLKVT